MKILHTSDWHFGKKLEGQSRIEEQKQFIENLVEIVKKESIDLILLAGDIFDTFNPPAEAQKLFFDSIKKLTKDGVGIIIIPGNHDNPQRLAAVSYLARDYGVIIYERALQEIPLGQYGQFNIYKSTKGGIFIEKDSKKLFIYSLPYPSETVLNESFDEVKFNDRICQILEEGVRANDENIPTVIMSHIYVAGTMGEDVAEDLGGARAIFLKDLPDANYIALGHIHKPVRFEKKNAYYCGSPIEYRITENKFNKKIFITQIDGNKNEVKEIELENYKPIKEYTVIGAQEAIKKSEELMENNEWIYLNIVLDEPLTNSEIRKIKSNKNILEIVPLIERTKKELQSFEYAEDNLEEMFVEFFKESSEGLEPNENIVNLFLELVEEEELAETN